MSHSAQRLLPAAFRLGCVLLGVATACAALGGLGWPFELFAHFGMQFAVAWAICGIVMLLQRLPLAALACALLSLLSFWPFGRSGSALATEPVCVGPRLEVVTANLHYRNESPAALLAWLQARRPDVISVQELTPRWASELGGLRDWPYRALLPRSDPYGIGLMSRLPLQDLTQLDLAGDGLPSLRGVLHVGAQEVEMLALHARWPLSPSRLDLRSAALEAAAAHVRGSQRPTVLAGDLNLSPGSPYFAQLLQSSGLNDALRGYGWLPTWRAGFWPLALRIDHVLVSPSVCVEAVEVGPDVGSDHRPVWVRLRLREA
jgi:endonuclease/exonuclease/phosphatase (EEP) superfamily protein YafD